jgi:heterotetrameric sarcosine oxidase delta subunit
MGDARPQRPASNDSATIEQWFDYVYLRANPKGVFDEYTHHSGGCRTWLVVSRDTLTHDVFAVVTAQDYARRRQEGNA